MPTSSTRSLLVGREIAVGRPNLGPREDILRLVERVMDSATLTNHGPLVQRLERSISERLGTECVLTSSGTSALELGLRNLPRGKVILPSFTFVATAHAVVAAGHTPVFADVDATSQCMTPSNAEPLIDDETVAILPVHLWGNPARPAEFEALANRSGTAVLFDAAHAFDSREGDAWVGGFGHMEAFSFHATKSFSCGEGGCISTRDSELAASLREQRTFGMDSLGRVTRWGGNYRMSELHAAIGLVNLDLLPEIAERNLQNFQAYKDGLRSTNIGRLVERSLGNSLTSYVILELDQSVRSLRDAVSDWLRKQGVSVKGYFSTPLHRMPPYQMATVSLPVSEALSKSNLALPTGLQIQPEECERLIRAISGFMDEVPRQADAAGSKSR